MTDSVFKQAKSQLGETTKKVVEDAGRQIADIPQEAGRHIVGMEGGAHHQAAATQDESFDEESLSLEERKENQKKLDLARIRELEKEIGVLIKRRESRNQKRIERVSSEMQDKPSPAPDETSISGNVSPFSKKLQSKKGSRELGRGMKG